jgi:CheY-like chemotaxis protein
MPIMNGFAVLEWIAQRKTGSRLRSVVLSDSCRPEDIERAKALGAAEHVVKPFSVAALALVAGQAARVHSSDPCFRPRGRKRRNPMACFTIPEIGSTDC